MSLTDETAQPISRTGDGSTPVSDANDAWETVADFSIESRQGNERAAIQRVREGLAPLNLNARTLDNLSTAVGEATMNAMEHGNKYQEDLPVLVRVEQSHSAIRVSVRDQGEPTAEIEAEAPNLDLKLAGLQTPRGWGLFLIERMVDKVEVVDDHHGHTLHLIVYRRRDAP